MKVVLYPEPVLLRLAQPISEVTDEVRERAMKMIEVMQLERGVGLAAPQVGWSARLFLASPDGEPENTTVYINPVILHRDGGTEWGEEGCLSFPGIYGEVMRHREVKMRALDLDGNEIEIEAEGFFARVLQHEADHLDGVVFTTKMRPACKAENKAAIEDLVRRYEERSAQSARDPSESSVPSRTPPRAGCPGPSQPSVFLTESTWVTRKFSVPLNRSAWVLAICTTRIACSSGKPPSPTTTRSMDRVSSTLICRSA